MGVGVWFHTGGRERKKGLTQCVLSLNLPPLAAWIKWVSPKLPAGFRESIQPPSIVPVPEMGWWRYVLQGCLFWQGWWLQQELSEGTRKGVFLSFFNPHLLESRDFRGLSVSLLCAIYTLRKLTALLSVGKAWKYNSEGFKISHKWRNQIQILTCFYPMFPWNQTTWDHDPLASPSRSGRDDIIRNNFSWQRVTENWKKWFLVDEPARDNTPASVSQTSEWTDCLLPQRVLQLPWHEGIVSSSGIHVLISTISYSTEE